MSFHPLATIDGLALTVIFLDMMARGVPPIERGYVAALLRQRPARWDEAWTEPGLGLGALTCRAL